MEGKVTQIHI